MEKNIWKFLILICEREIKDRDGGGEKENRVGGGEGGLHDDIVKVENLKD